MHYLYTYNICYTHTSYSITNDYVTYLQCRYVNITLPMTSMATPSQLFLLVLHTQLYNHPEVTEVTKHVSISTHIGVLLFF